MKLRHSLEVEAEDFSIRAFVVAMQRAMDTGQIPANAHLIISIPAGYANEAGKLPNGTRRISLSWVEDVEEGRSDA